MLKGWIQNQTRPKKVLLLIGVLLVGVLILAVIVGTLNVFVGDGEWSLWSTYRYDETGYLIGSASIGSDRVTSIEIDWIDGEVEIVLCEDALISITEEYEGELAENTYVRHKLDNNGTSLSVKYCASSAFLGFGSGGEDKKLTVRIPVDYLDQLESLTVNTKSADVKLEGIMARSLSVTTNRGDITANLPDDPGFSISAAEASSGCGSGKQEGQYGDGSCKVSLVSKRGSVDFLVS